MILQLLQWVLCDMHKAHFLLEEQAFGISDKWQNAS